MSGERTDLRCQHRVTYNGDLNDDAFNDAEINEKAYTDTILTFLRTLNILLLVEKKITVFKCLFCCHGVKINEYCNIFKSARLIWRYLLIITVITRYTEERQPVPGFPLPVTIY